MNYCNDWVDISAHKPSEDLKFLYILNFGQICKIGISARPKFRARTIENASGRSLQSGIVLNGIYDAAGLEVDAHKQLSLYRLKGEWFNLPMVEAVGKLSLSIDDYPVVARKGADLEAITAMACAFFQPIGMQEQAGYQIGLTIITHLAVMYDVSKVGGFETSQFIKDYSDCVEAMGADEWKDRFDEFRPKVERLMAHLVATQEAA